VFGIPFLEDGQGKWFIAVFALLMNVLFLGEASLLAAGKYHKKSC